MSWTKKGGRVHSFHFWEHLFRLPSDSILAVAAILWFLSMQT